MGFKTVVTGDGSLTVYSDEYAQSMHSTSGAYQEAMEKHVRPSRITERVGTVRVLDVGFGLGYNILALLMSAVGRRSGPVEVISLERDREAAGFLDAVSFGDERDRVYDTIRIACSRGFYSCPDYTISLLFGDARRTINGLPGDETFHAVFHDPFSPAMNPELWTIEFFTTLFIRMHQGAVLTTYSAAPQVRGAMLGAGFSLYRGPSVGGKREGTLAVKLIPPRDDEGIAGELASNYKGTPYRDPDQCLSREDILAARRQEMRRRRLTGDHPARRG